ncbi:MAG: preprotein translocase subunit SecY [Actinomycetota bacterium]|jgi:preprotein translocase subunit SecY|nr:preprotein translocase subunit SecY [Micrococcales bacterium]MDC3001559.1 preprotein translocase subunit SecY [Actinomycetota bacterium]MEC7362853.1 preprotein translocase subunit SecY [Actinomycetota bacterium]MEC8504382.1 preprotein translocase subunit SecY [Actinomycetota bacterium]MEC8647429.1 preprotein translocase subunit SecY [Actinomycetota bacterium]|tara:strand:+ start:4055 stop:5353 length:1299 start_codon:yes stop_codon:yes gene_type:complete
MHISAFGAALRTPDLRKKILFTLGLLGLYRLGAVLPTPGVDYAAIQRCIDVVQDNSVYALINLFSGGALLQLSVFALGIMPYITASIILQLLTVVIPRLETLKKDGQAGQAKITQYTRYVTIGLAVLQSTAILSLARTPGALFSGCNETIIPNQGIWVILVMVIVMTAGTAVVMWFGELITERGVGNGMSVLIFTAIIATIPAQFAGILGSRGTFTFTVTVLVGLAVIAFVVFVEQAQRRVPVQYAKRMVGRRMYGGTSTYIPLKVNMAGVIPVIFASSLLFLPTLFVQLTGSQAAWAQWVQQNFGTGSGTWYLLTYFLLVIFFCYFYVSITFNPTDVADNMKKYGGFIPGIRAGKPTADYLDYVLTRLTAPGSLYLGLIAVLPVFAFGGLGVAGDFIFGGTSLLIMVGVGLDTVKQIESQLQQRNYEGFLG